MLLKFWGVGGEEAGGVGRGWGGGAWALGATQSASLQGATRSANRGCVQSRPCHVSPIRENALRSNAL